jgi:hypothetical protein
MRYMSGMEEGAQTCRSGGRMPTCIGMFTIGRAGAAVCAMALVFGVPSVAGAATAASSSTTKATAPTTTTLPPNMPAFKLPTDDGLKLVQAHNQAEIEIVASQGALRPAQRGAKRARAHFEQVRHQLRKLNARARKTAQRLAASREHLRAAAVQAYIHSGSSQLSTALESLTNANSAVDVGSQLHMIGTYGRGEKNALDEYTALKKKVDAQVRLISERYDSAHNVLKKAVDKLNLIRLTISGAKQRLAESVMGMLQFHEAATSALSPILGPSRLSAKQMADYLKKIGARPNITVPTRVLAQLYLDEGAKVGVRGDVAFAQSILETGGFAHPGSSADNNNFAGIGWCDSCKHGFDFPDAQTGVRAQVQLLRIYVDPDFPDANYKDKLLLPGTLKLGFRGKVQTWWDLWGTWATGALYGQRVYDIYERMVAFAKTDPDPKPAAKPGSKKQPVGTKP